MPPDLHLVHPGRRAVVASSWNLLSERRQSSPVGDAPAEGRQAIWQAAIEADETGSIECPLESVWHDHVQGRLHAWWESVGPDRIILVARVTGSGAGVGVEDADILARVFAGQQQKVVASDLGIAPSTVSGRYVRTLDRLDLTTSAAPLPLVLAAQASLGLGMIPRARTAFFEAQGRVCMAVSVPRPN